MNFIVFPAESRIIKERKQFRNSIHRFYPLRSSFTFTAWSITKRMDGKGMPYRRKFLYCCQPSCSCSDLFMFHRAGCSHNQAAMPYLLHLLPVLLNGVCSVRQERQLLCHNAQARVFERSFNLATVLNERSKVSKSQCTLYNESLKTRYHLVDLSLFAAQFLHARR